jgi:5'-nucleotidase
MVPHRGQLERGQIYFGGNARLVEEALGIQSAQLLYVGDRLFGDVHVTKDLLHWRTTLVSCELEPEITDAIAFADDEDRLVAMMAEKVALDRRLAQLRLTRAQSGERYRELSRELDGVSAAARKLDQQITPMAKAAAELGHPVWGPLMCAGSDKSLFARKVERYADTYTSRVSNLRFETPYAYLRAVRSGLPHDRPPARPSREG